ncbi:alpha/beta fold hydrolase [Streptomyces omiyaensis]|uniref:alpha/beta fold hydrolase n=1 Tax=Streptomyces omiyaensis TaxID=68247 RepID=UPI001E30D536|nr:alpha/beta hydrolase [Streptomyces omiyaensis]
MSYVTREFVRGGVGLSLRDRGGDGPLVLLLHGLAGHCGEWDGLAARLAADGYRVLALDQRGHGASERRPADVSRAAHVEDVLGIVEAYGAGGPAALVGQSYGGLAALLAAARRHPAVAGAVLVEAGPAGSTPEEMAEVAGWLARWPVPFPGREAAVSFLGGGPVGEGWASGLEERDGGWWPRFDASVLADSLRENALRDWWEEWDAIDVPLLCLLGEKGIIGAEQWDGMARRQPGLRGICLPGAGHDVHLERPEEVYGAVAAFLRDVVGAGGGSSPGAGDAGDTGDAGDAGDAGGAGDAGAR